MLAESSKPEHATKKYYVRRHIPEGDILHSHRYENLKSYIETFCSLECRTMNKKKIIVQGFLYNFNDCMYSSESLQLEL
jgi:hypothetical protein